MADFARRLERFCRRQRIERVINPLEVLSRSEIRERYRFQPESLVFLLGLIFNALESPTFRSSPLPPMISLLLTLQFYASGAHFIVIGDIHGVSKSSVSRAVRKTTAAICSLRERYIKLPTNDTARTIHKEFYNIATKEKYDSNKKTGGGPAACLTPTDELVVNHLLANNKAQITGLEDGVDSLIPPSTKQLLPYSKPVTAANMDGETTCVTVQEVFEGDNIIDRDINSLNLLVDREENAEKVTEKRQLSPKVGRQKSAKKYREDTEDDLYALERKRLLLEIEVVEQKKFQEHQLFLTQREF